MKEVQKEIETLKVASSEETANKTYKEYTCKLEDAIKWFKNEAIRLSKTKKIQDDELSCIKQVN